MCIPGFPAIMVTSTESFFPVPTLTNYIGMCITHPAWDRN